MNKVILSIIPVFLTVFFRLLEDNGILITNNASEICLFATVLTTFTNVVSEKR